MCEVAELKVSLLSPSDEELGQLSAGSGSDKVQGVAPVSFNLFGVNGGIIKRVPPISHWI